MRAECHRGILACPAALLSVGGEAGRGPWLVLDLTLEVERPGGMDAHRDVLARGLRLGPLVRPVGRS